MIPPLAELLRHMADMPPVFREKPEGVPGGRVCVAAVVSDLFESLGVGAGDSIGLEPDVRKCFSPADDSPAEENRLAFVLFAAHLLRHDAFHTVGLSAARLRKFFLLAIPTLAWVVPATKFLEDPERHEELIRRLLRHLGLTFEGETPETSEDRFRQVDSVERQAVVREAAHREKRARKVREAMAKKAAEEAAAKVTRE